MRHKEAGPGFAGQAVMAELGRSEALALLPSARVGRVVFTVQALPAIRPVNFAVCRGDVVFRVAAESRLATALDDAVVAFEADELDAGGASGWSVVVTGLAELLICGAEFDYLIGHLPEPWAPGPHECVVRIRAELVTGRRITRLAS